MKLLCLVALLTLISACGTTSEIRKNETEKANIDLTQYDCVVVLDFGDQTKKRDLPEYAGSNFAAKISSEIRGKGVFREVYREKSGDKCLVIGGNITRYEEGNPTLKFLVGLGAGSTYFDALVVLQDSISDAVLGEVLVDKNSWALGGGIAASQTVDSFMNEAAYKMANELAKAKLSQEGGVSAAQETSPTHSEPSQKATNDVEQECKPPTYTDVRDGYKCARQ